MEKMAGEKRIFCKINANNILENLMSLAMKNLSIYYYVYID